MGVIVKAHLYIPYDNTVNTDFKKSTLLFTKSFTLQPHNPLVAGDPKEPKTFATQII